MKAVLSMLCYGLVSFALVAGVLYCALSPKRSPYGTLGGFADPPMGGGQ